MKEKLINVLYKAGEYLKNAHCTSNDIDTKPGEANFVTKHDIVMQNFLKKELLKIFPEAAFMGEEDGENNYKQSDICVIVDPIDGTTNFIKDYRHSCISVAILKHGKPYIGAVYDPYLNDMFSAEFGKGAFLGNKKLKISTNGLTNALVAFGTCPYYPELADKTFTSVQKVFKVAADVRRSGSAALDICYVAAGRTELFFEYLLSPWDYAAAALILTEAGGVIKTDSEKGLSYDKPCPIIAATKKAFDEFIEITTEND